MIGARNCCCCCSLRTGAMVLAFFMTLIGVLGLFQHQDLAILAAIFNIFCGALGFYASYSRNARWLRIFFYVLLFMFVLDLCALIFFILLHQYWYSQTDTTACDDAANP